MQLHQRAPRAGSFGTTTQPLLPQGSGKSSRSKLIGRKGQRIPAKAIILGAVLAVGLLYFAYVGGFFHWLFEDGHYYSHHDHHWSDHHDSYGHHDHYHEHHDHHNQDHHDHVVHHEIHHDETHQHDDHYHHYPSHHHDGYARGSSYQETASGARPTPPTLSSYHKERMLMQNPNQPPQDASKDSPVGYFSSLAAGRDSRHAQIASKVKDSISQASIAKKLEGAKSEMQIHAENIRQELKQAQQASTGGNPLPAQAQDAAAGGVHTATPQAAADAQQHVAQYTQPAEPTQQPVQHPSPQPSEHTIPQQQVHFQQPSTPQPIPEGTHPAQQTAGGTQPQHPGGVPAADPHAAQAAQVQTGSQETVPEVHQQPVPADIPSPLQARVSPPGPKFVEEGTMEDVNVGVLARSLFDLNAVDISGNVVPLSNYRGKVLLIVNVASKCGYTDQNYKALQLLYQKYHHKGLEILAFPCNQFGQQESGTRQDILRLAVHQYHVSFPMFDKIEVNGSHRHPLYSFLMAHLPPNRTSGIRNAVTQVNWNFYKFLVDHHGMPYSVWDQSMTNDWQHYIEMDIDKLLEQRNAESPPGWLG